MRAFVRACVRARARAKWPRLNAAAKADLQTNFDVIAAVLRAFPARVPKGKHLQHAFEQLDADYGGKLCLPRTRIAMQLQLAFRVSVIPGGLREQCSQAPCACCCGRPRSGNHRKSAARRDWAKAEGDKLRLLVSHVRKSKRKTQTDKSRPRTATPEGLDAIA